MRKALWMLLAALPGCGTPVADARPQWRVTVATDAPIPQFGDRVLIEILDDQGEACSGCRRQLGVDRPDQWAFSFGVAPPQQGGLRIRVRLYRTAVTGWDGAPGSDRVIDALVRLPAPDGITDVAIPLMMSCFGVVADLDGGTSCDPKTGLSAPIVTLSPESDPSLPGPGEWAPAADIECPTAPEPGMVCIPGGVFLMGDPDFLPTGDLDSIPEQLVRLGPFQLDVQEMTVARMRALVTSGKVSAPISKGTGSAAHCTYGAAGGDDLPANCLSRAQARAACEALEKRLPTEAEWEFAAGNRRDETPYPWGAGSPCDHAWVARGDPLDVAVSSACQASADPLIGPQPADPATTDVTALGVRDLGGNVNEWVEDDFARYADPICWGEAPTLHVDPRCQTGNQPALRGGSWGGLPAFAHASGRNAALKDGPSPLTGFRCAR